MGREIIVKPLQFPAALKEHRIFLFIGPEDLSDVEHAIDVAGFLNELVLPEQVRLSFFAPVSLNRLGMQSEVGLDQAAAVLYNIQDKFSLPVVSNVGDWKNLEKVQRISQVILLDDYLILNKTRLIDFFKKGTPAILDTRLLSETELMELTKLIDQYKAPCSLLKQGLKEEDLGLIDNYFVSSRISFPDKRLVESALALGVKGFLFSCGKEKKDRQFIRELIKLF